MKIFPALLPHKIHSDYIPPSPRWLNCQACPKTAQTSVTVLSSLPTSANIEFRVCHLARKKRAADRTPFGLRADRRSSMCIHLAREKSKYRITPTGERECQGSEAKNGRKESISDKFFVDVEEDREIEREGDAAVDGRSEMQGSLMHTPLCTDRSIHLQ